MCDQRVIIGGGAEMVDLSRHCMLVRLSSDRKLLRLISRATLLTVVILSFFWLVVLHNAAKEDLREQEDVDILHAKNEYNAETSSIVSAESAVVVAAAMNDDQEALSGSGGVGGRRLFSVNIPESKKEALDGLEGAVLEPPTKKKYRRRTRYLPDLMGDSLAGYPRRVFVDVGAAGRPTSDGWFKRHYPNRDLDFEIIRVDVEVEAGRNGEREEGMTEWLRRNIKEEEYVVMKAEAEVVLEMVKGKTIGLVDELFLECRNQWHKEKKNKKSGGGGGGGGGGEGMKSRRAYWECLALYGRLKDEGIAVHQWWD